MKLSGSSVVGTPLGLARIEELELGKVYLYSIFRNTDNTITEGFRPYTLSECVNKPCELKLKNRYLNTITTPDTRVITDIEVGSFVRAENSYDIKLPISSYIGLPAVTDWELDLSLVSDFEDARVIDIRDTEVNVLLILALKYGYATESGCLSLPIEFKEPFVDSFDLEIAKDQSEARENSFIVERNDLTDLAVSLIQSGRELPDEIVLNVEPTEYLKAYMKAIHTFANTFIPIAEICGTRECPLDNYYKSLSYILLRDNRIFKYRKGDVIQEEITSDKYKSYISKEEGPIQLMYELTSEQPDTYLVADGLIFY